jgi:hypothetical protein
VKIVTYDADYDPSADREPPPIIQSQDAKMLSQARAANPNFGKVPSYINDIKGELAEKKAKRE